MASLNAAKLAAFTILFTAKLAAKLYVFTAKNLFKISIDALEVISNFKKHVRQDFCLLALQPYGLV